MLLDGHSAALWPSESCFWTIKTELEMTEYPDSQQARRDIAGYLAYYNHERRHSSLNYLTPTVFKDQFTQST
jgi:putative transposase